MINETEATVALLMRCLAPALQTIIREDLARIESRLARLEHQLGAPREQRHTEASERR